MVDFLTRLVTVTYGDAPVMRPRPIAPYEPATTLLPPPDEPATDVAPVASSAQTAPPNTPSSATQWVASSPSVPVGPVAGPASSAPPPGMPPLAAPAGRRHALAARTTASQEKPLDDSMINVHHTEPPAATPPVRAATPSRLTPAQPTPAPVALAVASPQPGPALRQIETRDAPVSPHAAPPAPLPSPHVAEVGGADVIGRRAQITSTAAPVALATQRAAVVAATDAASRGDRGASEQRSVVRLPDSTPPGQVQHSSRLVQAEATTSPAPVVRVTIGRIVIKAEPAAPRAPVRGSQPTAPTLSLDQYLKGRDGGGT